jgi:hypothetical protein
MITGMEFLFLFDGLEWRDQSNERSEGRRGRGENSR